ncbi:XRE family transcriptional regulator [Halosaccharopolyspora lacisalsi]|nr:XRE family transcriptional regulator [Halosaccharopolyspora lacisalsi]
MGRNERLHAARQATPSPRVPGACLSRAELAEAVNTWLTEHTDRPGALDEQAIARYERGTVRRPNRDYRAALRAVLGADQDTELGFIASGPSHEPLKQPHTIELDPARVWSPDEQARVEHVSGCARRVDQPVLDALAGTLAAVRRLEDETSAADVLPSVVAQARLADRLADNAPSGLHSTALGLASEIAQYRGWLAIPRGQWDESRAHLDRAAVLAVQADDPLRLATALSFNAYRAMLVDDIPTAASLADAAGRESRVDPGLRTYMTVQRAEIAAYGRDTNRAARLLAEADHMIEQLPPAEELPDSSYWYTPSVLTGHKGFVLQALGEHEAARRAAAESLDAMPETWRRSEWAVQHRALAEA